MLYSPQFFFCDSRNQSFKNTHQENVGLGSKNRISLNVKTVLQVRKSEVCFYCIKSVSLLSCIQKISFGNKLNGVRTGGTPHITLLGSGDQCLLPVKLSPNVWT